MPEFVRAQIFGTTFEITSRYAELIEGRCSHYIFDWKTDLCHRYSDLQPIGMGAFGLIWYEYLPMAICDAV